MCRDGVDSGEEHRWNPWPVEFIRKHCTRILTNSLMQSLILCSYLLYLGTSIFCFFTSLRQGLQVSNLVPYDSHTHQYLKVYEKYFSRYTSSAEIVIAQPLEYFDVGVQERILAMVSSFENGPYTLKADFWLPEFLDLLNEPIPSRSAFYDFLLNKFLRSEPYFRYAADIILMETRHGELFINSTRFYIPLTNMGGQNRSAGMAFLLKTARKAGADGFSLHIYDVSFPLTEQYQQIVPGMLTSVSVAGSCMLAIALLFIPSFRDCLAVAFTVISINVGVVGFLSMWNVRLDIISTITILLSIGFSIDFSSHIAYHFHHSRGQCGAAKLKSALELIGWPIVQSSISTLVGVVTVIGVKAYVSDTFVKTVVLVMIIGLYHGLFVLPLLLILLTDGCKLCQRLHSEYYSKSYGNSQGNADPSFTEPGGFQNEGQNDPPEIKTDVLVPRVAVVHPTPIGTAQRNFYEFTHEHQETLRVNGQWLDAWLHGDLACCARKGKYCAYCQTRTEVESKFKKLMQKKNQSGQKYHSSIAGF